jgi:hypothetical protein
MLDATERRALTATTFTAACICFAPAQIISGAVLLAAALLLHLYDQRMLRRENVAAPATMGPPVANPYPGPAEPAPSTTGDAPQP